MPSDAPRSTCVRMPRGKLVGVTGRPFMRIRYAYGTVAWAQKKSAGLACDKSHKRSDQRMTRAEKLKFRVYCLSTGHDRGAGPRGRHGPCGGRAGTGASAPNAAPNYFLRCHGSRNNQDNIMQTTHRAYTGTRDSVRVLHPGTRFTTF